MCVKAAQCGKGERFCQGEIMYGIVIIPMVYVSVFLFCVFLCISTCINSNVFNSHD